MPLQDPLAPLPFTHAKAPRLFAPLYLFVPQIRRPYEKLLRKLLNYPNKPAVVQLHAYKWWAARAHARMHACICMHACVMT